MGMKNLVEIEVVQCERAQQFNVATKKQEPKASKDGNPVYNLFYILKNKKKVGTMEVEEQTVEKIGSLIELKPGKYILEVELFSVEKKIFHRVTALHK